MNMTVIKHANKLIIEKGDHSLEIEGNYRASLPILGQICDLYDEFFKI